MDKTQHTCRGCDECEPPGAREIMCKRILTVDEMVERALNSLKKGGDKDESKS